MSFDGLHLVWHTYLRRFDPLFKNLPEMSAFRDVFNASGREGGCPLVCATSTSPRQALLDEFRLIAEGTADACVKLISVLFVVRTPPVVVSRIDPLNLKYKGIPDVVLPIDTWKSRPLVKYAVEYRFRQRRAETGGFEPFAATAYESAETLADSEEAIVFDEEGHYVLNADYALETTPGGVEWHFNSVHQSGKYVVHCGHLLNEEGATAARVIVNPETLRAANIEPFQYEYSLSSDVAVDIIRPHLKF